MFKKKLIVALITAPPFAYLWWLGDPYFTWLMAAFSAIAADEVACMGAAKNPTTRITAAVSALALYLPLVMPMPWSITEGMLLVLLVSFLGHLFVPGDMSTVGSRVGVSILGAVYGALPAAFLIAVRAIEEHGRGLAFLALSLSWFCDTFAYAGGKFFGKHKLYPKMSPNKTIEGLAAGALAAAVGAVIVTRVAGIPWSIPFALGLGVVAAIWGQIGDLCESMLKRSFGVKDAGWILPGHGGVLDRFDAVLFVAPLVYYAWRISSS